MTRSIRIRSCNTGPEKEKVTRWIDLTIVHVSRELSASMCLPPGETSGGGGGGEGSTTAGNILDPVEEVEIFGDADEKRIRLTYACTSMWRGVHECTPTNETNDYSDISGTKSKWN